MGPKKDNSHNKLETETVLQAVVLADSFNERFMPFTLEKPRCLLPLVNMPLLEYTFEFLAVSGVEEIFLFCCAHADKIKEYIRSSRWSQPSCGLKVQVIVSQEFLSLGDVLRDADTRKLLHTDFILVSGDIVSNLKVDRIVAEHKERREKDKNVIMTMVLKEASSRHRTRATGESSLFAFNPSTSICVHHQSMEYYPQKSRFSIDMEPHLGPANASASQLHTVIRNDLIDCQIDICSIDVPPLFTENFDYQEMRNDFVHGMLTSDLLGKKIATSIVTGSTGAVQGVYVSAKDNFGGLGGGRMGGYAARVRSTQMYDSVSKDILSRWSFPMVPDSNVLSNTKYTHMRGLIYKDENVLLSRTCHLDDKVVIGSGTEIGENTIIKNSTLGRNCKIGANVKIEGAYLWDNVVIGNDCTVTRSIIADGAVLKNGVVVEKGCLLSFGVQVGPHVTLPAFTKVTKFVEDENAPPQCDLQALGQEAEGYIWTPDDEDDEDDDERKNATMAQLAYELPPSTSLGSLEDLSDDDESGDDSDTNEYEGENNFEREVSATMKRAVESNHQTENVHLELMGLKMAFNKSVKDLRILYIQYLLGMMDFSKGFTGLKPLVERWKLNLHKLGSELDDKIHCCTAIQEGCLYHNLTGRNFLDVMKVFYDMDILEQEIILLWYRYHWQESPDDPKEKEQRDSIALFIQWLKSDDAEGSEEESSEEDSEEESSEEDEEEEEEGEGEEEEED